MKLVVGLGNPGRRYENTRHNVGFEVLAELASRHGQLKPKIKFESEVVEIMVGGEKTLLIAPQTYMNASGRGVRQFVSFYQHPIEELVVICDDMNLNLGQLRLRGSGSAGGQKGLNDIIQRLGSNQIPRLRIGIGRPPKFMDATDYVLGRIGKSERDILDETIRSAADAVETWIADGLASAMNRFNAPPKGEST